MATSVSAVPAGNLPAEPNGFIGRTRDLDELTAMLARVRELTLCGPGGIGKTRLALRVAGLIGPGYPDGAWLIDLADVNPVQAPDRLLSLLTGALGIRAEPGRTLADTAAEALAPRRLLLILDTCEHVAQACAELAERLLVDCPGLRVIATSREPLRMRGETIWRVPPLGVPADLDDGGPPDARELARCEAVQLFVTRAVAVHPGFALTSANATAVAEVCRRLEGLPLAIELAAARIRTLSAAQISERLADKLEFLGRGDRTAPQRQQTLRAAVAWSYDLLTDAEQLLLARLSVFHGWDLEMAERVCADAVIPASDVLGLLTALIDKSLVVVEAELHGETRYRLLDTVRDLAAEHVATPEQLRALRLAHRDCMLELAERIASRAFVRGDPPWPQRVAMYQRVMADRPNFRLALACCADYAETDAGLRLCDALSGSWLASGDVAEGASWLDQLLALDSPVRPGVRARACAVRAELAFEQQDYDRARRHAQACLELSQTCADGDMAGALRLLALLAHVSGRADEALASAEAAVAAGRQAGDAWEEGMALAALAAVTAADGEAARALGLYEQALDVLRDNNGWGIANVRYGLGRLARSRGELAAAVGHFEAALSIYREIDARPEMARCLAGIGLVALARGDLGTARTILTESLGLSLATGHRLPMARSLAALASVSALEGDCATAIKVASAARELFAAIGVAAGAAGGRLDELLAQAQDAVDADLAAGLIAEGANLTAYDAALLAMAEPGAGQAAAAQASARPLTDREWQVAELVAQGLSNRDIGQQLYISTATAARHIANIFGKLGVNSRSQVAAWMAGDPGGRPPGGLHSAPPSST